VIYLYAIVDGPGAARPPLRELAYGDVVAVYREMASVPDATVESLRHQEGVLERLMDQHEVLPLRFGSTVADEDELLHLLATRHDEFAVSLARVRGRVEMGVRANAHNGRRAAPTGREYLARKLERKRVAAAVHAELAELAHVSSMQVTSDPGPGFAASYLVDRDRVADFRRRFDSVRGSRSDFEMVCTGPWPPFSFATAEEAS
jgi:hypothetical protein